MANDFGISEGAKSISGSIDAAREAGKGLTKSIESIITEAKALIWTNLTKGKVVIPRILLFLVKHLFSFFEITKCLIRITIFKTFN